MRTKKVDFLEINQGENSRGEKAGQEDFWGEEKPGSLGKEMTIGGTGS